LAPFWNPGAAVSDKLHRKVNASTAQEIRAPSHSRQSKPSEKIRFQVMENGLDLRNYLLSGDPRQGSGRSKWHKDLASLIREAQNKTSDDRVREAYSVIESNQRSWEDDFSKP